MTGDVAARVRSARERTTAERTARMRQAVTAPGADVESDPSVESSGTVDFVARRAAIASRLGTRQAEFLANVTGAHSGEQPVDEAAHIQAIFIGDEVYDLGAGGRWFRNQVEWWRRPLWSLDALQAAGSEWANGEVTEIHGIRTRSLSGSIDRRKLRELDRYWHKLLGRRGKDDLPARVWLDEAGRATRIAWTLPASQVKHGDWPSWTITEFWDWGLPVTIAPPSDA